VDTESRADETSVTRRDLLRTGAAGVLGAAAATAVMATPSSADDGDPIILGQENVAFSPTQISFADSGDVMEIFSASGGVLRVDTGFGRFGISSIALSGTGVIASGSDIGISGGGNTEGVLGLSNSGTGIGVRGNSAVGTGVKAEVSELQEGTAFEAVGPVKFSTSGLADVAASADRVTVDPGVPISAQSKVLATLQGNAGNKSMVEHVELDPAADTFQIVLTKPSMRPVQVAWFLIS
jgi:hypothetical protein